MAYLRLRHPSATLGSSTSLVPTPGIPPERPHSGQRTVPTVSDHEVDQHAAANPVSGVLDRHLGKKRLRHAGSATARSMPSPDEPITEGRQHSRARSDREVLAGCWYQHDSHTLGQPLSPISPTAQVSAANSLRVDPTRHNANRRRTKRQWWKVPPSASSPAS